MTSAMSPTLVGGRTAIALSVLSGLLYFLAFPGIGLWPIAFFALVPLMVALEGRALRPALGLGWITGFVMTVTGFYWLVEMLRVFSGFPTALCLLFAVLLCLYQGATMAVVGGFTARLTERRWPFGLAFSLGFVVSELVFPVLFRWYFGASVHSVWPLVQIADLGGPITISLTLVAVNLALFGAVRARLKRQRLNWNKSVALLCVPVLAIGYGLIRAHFVDRAAAEAPHATVGLVQANMSLLGKRHDLREGLRRHLRLTKHLLANHPLDLVVWSETSVMRAVDEDRIAKEVPRVVGRHIGTNAIFGAVLVRPVDDSRGYVFFNSALATDRKGVLRGRYDKHYLLAFGEYLPFGDTFPILYDWSPNSGRFSAGKSLDPLPIEGHPVATIICYEDLSPSFVNSLFRHEDAQLLVNMTNDAWFGKTTEPYSHFALAKLRAVEQRRYFVRSTNSGVSGVIDPVGRTLVRSKIFRQATLEADVAWMSGSTVYRVLGDLPWWLATAAAAILLFVRRKVRPGATAPSTVAEEPATSAEEPATSAEEPQVPIETPPPPASPAAPADTSPESGLAQPIEGPYFPPVDRKPDD